ncbi:MAG: hypothetical protein KatS3mg051_1050 [Anaerolineae bacterium]|nr:MAG: hypothetical protein KatS3mg051_1050 [Anaerolineae bacterium]
MTWKPWATPSGRLLFRLRPWAHRISRELFIIACSRRSIPRPQLLPTPQGLGCSRRAVCRQPPSRNGSQASERNNPWSTEPGVARVAYGVPHRVDRVRALGNAVVPQAAELVGRLILAVEEGNRCNHEAHDVGSMVAVAMASARLSGRFWLDVAGLSDATGAAPLAMGTMQRHAGECASTLGRNCPRAGRRSLETSLVGAGNPNPHAGGPRWRLQAVGPD